MPGKWLKLMLLSLALCVGLGAAFGQGAVFAQAKTQGKAKNRKVRPRPVVVAHVRQVSELPTVKANGLLAPVKKALLSVDVPGRVAAIHAREGERIEKGQILAELVNSDLTLDRKVLIAFVKEAEAQLALSRQKMSRAQSLFKKKLASAEQFENEEAATEVTKAKLASSQAQLKRLEEKLAMMVVRAPISGQVIKADLEIGQWISSTKPIYEIYNYDRFEMLVGVPGRFINKINKDKPVTVLVTEIGHTLQGKIVAIVRHVDSASGNFVIRIEVENPGRIPLSGLLAQIDVPVGNKGKVLVVPRDAVVRRAGKTQIVVIRKGAAAVVSVRVEGNFDQDEVIVIGKGLKPKEPVVVRGNERLFSGAPVRVTGTF